MYEEGREEIQNDESAQSVDDSSEIASEEASSDIPSDNEIEEVNDTSSPQEDSVNAQNNELEYLRTELERVRGELDRRERENERIKAEMGEFSSVFPEVKLESVPREVWESVKGGVPLAAAYALYEKKAIAHERLAQSVNAKNSEQSSGAIGKKYDSGYYSPAEVRKMSAAEVREKYNVIIESMKKWK